MMVDHRQAHRSTGSQVRRWRAPAFARRAMCLRHEPEYPGGTGDGALQAAFVRVDEGIFLPSPPKAILPGLGLDDASASREVAHEKRN